MEEELLSQSMNVTNINILYLYACTTYNITIFPYHIYVHRTVQPNHLYSHHSHPYPYM